MGLVGGVMFGKPFWSSFRVALVVGVLWGCMLGWGHSKGVINSEVFEVRLPEQVQEVSPSENQYKGVLKRIPSSQIKEKNVEILKQSTLFVAAIMWGAVFIHLTVGMLLRFVLNKIGKLNFLIYVVSFVAIGLALGALPILLPDKPLWIKIFVFVSLFFICACAGWYSPRGQFKDKSVYLEALGETSNLYVHPALFLGVPVFILFEGADRSFTYNMTVFIALSVLSVVLYLCVRSSISSLGFGFAIVFFLLFGLGMRDGSGELSAIFILAVVGLVSTAFLYQVFVGIPSALVIRHFGSRNIYTHMWAGGFLGMLFLAGVCILMNNIAYLPFYTAIGALHGLVCSFVMWKHSKNIPLLEDLKS